MLVANMKVAVLAINIMIVNSIVTFNYEEESDIIFSDDGTRIKGASNKENKDLVLAAIIPIHNHGEDHVTCSNNVWPETLDYLEAILYSIDVINSDENILPNINLGYDIRDSCLTQTIAVDEAVDLVLLSNADRCQGNDLYMNSDTLSPPASVIIGEYASFVTVPVADFLHLFDVPLISFSSTSPLLSNRDRYKHFFRTVPSDSQQAQAMIDLVLHFEWTFISTIHSNDDYGEPGMERFKELANKNDICIHLDIGLSDDFTDSQYTDVVNKVYKSIPDVIVLFSSRNHAEKLFNKIEQVYNGSRRFLWIASDAWVESGDILSKPDIIGGMWGVIPESIPVPDFFSYYSKLTPSLNKRNPWFIDFYQSYHKCPNDSSCIAHNGSITSHDDYIQYSFTSRVIDSVFAFAHAVNNYLLDNCNKPIKWNTTTRNCEGHTTSLDGPTIRDYLKNVSFTSPTGSSVKFDKTGSTTGIYKIINYQLGNSSSVYEPVTVAKWDGTQTNSSKLKIYEDVHLQFSIDSTSQPLYKVESHCPICSAGSVTQNVPSSCCGTCIHCIGQNYTPSTELQQCMVCPDKMWGNNPINGSDSCQKITETYLGPNDPWGVILILVACLGIIGVAFVSVTIGIYWNTPIIKASGREQMILLLVGIALSYLCSVFFVIKPSITICTFQRISLWFCLSLIICALLVKLVRIARIFMRKRTSGRPKFIGPSHQILFTFVLVGFQMMLLITSFTVVYPGAEETVQLNSKNTYGHPSLVIRCKTSHVALIALHMLYLTALIIASNVISLLTIKFPANFREVVYVALSTFCIGIIWIAFVITYLQAPTELQDAITCFSIQMTATTVLICMFGVRIFIIIFMPERNVMQATFTKNTSQSISTALGTVKSQNNEPPVQANEAYMKIKHDSEREKDSKEVVVIKDEKDDNDIVCGSI